MDYKPKDIPEGINVSKGDPLKDSFRLIAFIAVAGVCIYVSLGWLSSSLGQRISFAQEVKWFGGGAVIPELAQSSNPGYEPGSMEKLVGDLWAHFPDSEKAPLKVSTLPMSSPNAFMALGGRLSVTQGLLTMMKHENELAFVLCHEIGHFHGRHVVKAAGRSLVFSLMASFMGIDNSSFSFIRSGIELGELSFSRKQETQADLFAMDCMAKHYGHVNGYDRFLKWAEDEEGKRDFQLKFSNYLKTHPISEDRLKRIATHIEKMGYSTHGELLPLGRNQ